MKDTWHVKHSKTSVSRYGCKINRKKETEENQIMQQLQFELNIYIANFDRVNAQQKRGYRTNEIKVTRG